MFLYKGIYFATIQQVVDYYHYLAYDVTELTNQQVITMKLLTRINKRIDSLKASERVTKAELSALSRELLEYIIVGTGEGDATFDIQPVNRLLSVLTPMNQRTAVLYFREFLPFKFDDQQLSFGELQKGKKDKFIIKARTFLADENNDIWSWAERNIKVEKKPVDWSKKITGDIQKALNAEDDALTPKEVMVAVLAGGITADDLANIMQAIIDGNDDVELEADAA